MRRAPVSVSPAFEAVARDARFHDLIAVPVKASPEAIFQALHEITLRDMKLAWFLGELRYLPSRLAGRMPATDSARPFLSMLLEGGTLVLRDEEPREVITGSAAQLHRVHQAPRRFANRGAFDAFNDPDHEKLFMSVRVAPTGRTDEQWLVLEHATRALSPRAERRFSRYWRVIKPVGAFVTWQLLRAVRRRAELATAGTGRHAHASGFRTPGGKAAFLAAYDAAMKRWPVAREELDIPTPFGMTHVVVSGPKAAPPLVLLHGYMATSVMWAPNIADFSADHRVYAVDVMGQPGKSIPAEPVRDVSDYVEWLAATLDGLGLGRVSLLGMSFGGWLALSYAAAAPERVRKLVLLSPGGLLPLVRQFTVRGMLMTFMPTRFTVNSFMRWAGFSDRAGDNDARPVLDLMYLGMKHFRIPQETLRVAPEPLTDGELTAIRMPVLLLIGDREVIYDPANAMARARRCIPHVEGGLVPDCRHEMCFSQSQIVDARVRLFLDAPRIDTDRRGEPSAA